MTSIDGPLAQLRRCGFSLSGLARAHGLDPIHLKNALAQRSPLRHEELKALTAATDLPVTELLSPEMLERALSR